MRKEMKMKKLIATLCVIAWSFCGAFGFLALTAHDMGSTEAMIDAVLAMVGFLVGMMTWVRLSREAPLHCACGLPVIRTIAARMA